MTANPAVTVRHLAHRLQCLSWEVIKGTGQPIGEVLDFFRKIEFQLKGSPHVHSMWWIKDALNLGLQLEDRLLHSIQIGIYSGTCFERPPLSS